MDHILYDEVMKYNPKNHTWLNRDRFYALLHLAGFDTVKEKERKMEKDEREGERAEEDESSGRGGIEDEEGEAGFLNGDEGRIAPGSPSFREYFISSASNAVERDSGNTGN
ncbi:hypothetical protein NE237_028277 [Protea cynaroides]|uniref:Uncharacterized protein n=1 Tax=Protea cynaroides TaxID=273540 RepID=A0A9Q0GS32_9MAGN|nr:hypothetical protein NE237_028277 [Protea cynaroides]